MFDIATRALPMSALDGQKIPFDWLLADGRSTQAMPFTDFSSGQPAAGVQLLQTFALQAEDTLQTAIIISLFTDKRAGKDERLPWGNTDRRGWLGEYYSHEGWDGQEDSWGSELWLLYVGKRLDSVLARAQFACEEALAWMVRDGLAKRVACTAEWVSDVLAVRPQVWQGADENPVYDVLWATSLRRSNLGSGG